MFYKIILLFVLVLSSLLMSGCWYIPISHGDMPIDTDEVQPMLGSSIDVIEKRFGCPDWELRDSEHTYYIYESTARASSVWMAFFVPIGWESAGSVGECERCEWADEEHEEPLEAMHCVMLEFDRDQVLRRYKTRADRDWGEGLHATCKHLFWTNDELNLMDDTSSCGIH